MSQRPASRHYVTVAVASMIGTTIEWYDFFLYSTAAALIFNKLFFPNYDPLVGTLAALATYSVGFFARPFGGVVCGHFGDRIGRKSMLLATLLLMGIPTILIGLMPTYRQIGPWAAVLLVILRILQGIAVGGEWGGAALMSVEHAPAGRKGLFGSLPQAGVGIGLALSSLAMAQVSRLPEADMLSWGWRLPFLASAFLLGVGWFIRIRIAESPVFERVLSAGERSTAPLVTVLKLHPRATLQVIGARLAEVSWFYLVATYTLTYATTQLGLSKPIILHAVVAGAAAQVIMVPLLGHLGDRIGQRRVYGLGAVCLIAFAFPYFDLLQRRDAVSVWFAVVPALSIVAAMMYSQQSALFAAQFPAAVRYSGISLGVQSAGAVGGGLTPLIAAALVARSGATTGVSLYFVALGIVAVACTLGMSEARASE